VEGGLTTKYYLAGGQRIAMRSGGTLYYLLGDHLGSTSLTTDSAGSVVSELRYTAWGEVRYQAGTTPTNYTYTGQYSNTADFGLMYYGARMYDPALGRFTSADSIVPGGVQGLDRYAYVNNNPVRYTDPSGHCPAWGVLVMGTIWCGEQAGGLGIMRSMLWTQDTRIASALSVQSQWLAPWDLHITQPLLEATGRYSSGFGIGQITDAEMKEFGLKEGSQDLPWVAAKAMQMRIDKVLGACDGFTCSAEDKLIATALAQNGGFNRKDFRLLLSSASSEGIKWEKYFSAREDSGDKGGVLGFRAEGYGEGQGGFDTRFMLRLYINDLLAYERLGWKLPYDFTRKQMIDIRNRYNNMQ